MSAARTFARVALDAATCASPEALARALTEVQRRIEQALRPLTSAVNAPLRPVTPAGGSQPNALYFCRGAPPPDLGQDGDYALRVDTPSTANQRLYVHRQGAWAGIV